MTVIIQVAQSLLKRYLNNVFFKRFASILGIDILVKASGFFLLPVFLHIMIEEEFALYNYFLSIIQTFSLVLNMGLYIAQTKLYHSVSSKEERGQLLFTLIVILLLFISFVCFPIALFNLDYDIVNFLFKQNLSYKAYRGILFLALLATVFSFMLTNFFYTSEKIKQVRVYNICRIIGINLISLLALYFIPGDAIRIRLVYTYGVEAILFVFFSYYFVREMIPVFSKKLMKQSIIIGFPIMVASLFGIIVNFSDKFLLQNYSTLKDLSNYYLAFSFASIIPLIFNSFQNVWLPLFMKEKSIENSFQRVKQLITKLMLFFIPVSIFIWGLYKVLIEVRIIPVKYSNAGSILPFLLMAQLFAALAPMFSNYLVYFEKTNLISLSGFLVSIVSIILGILLVPVWGVYGAAISTLAANALYFLLYYWMSKEVIKKHKEKIVKTIPL